MSNDCLRSACLSDAFDTRIRFDHVDDDNYAQFMKWHALRKLYDAEWRKRGFERSP
jgi:hypothetical protein